MTAPHAENQLPNYGYVTAAVLEDALCYRVDSKTGAEIVGKRATPNRSYAGLVIPYYLPGETHPRMQRLRRDTPDLEQGHDGKVKQKGKYLSPPGMWGRSCFYFPPKTPASYLDDNRIPVVITEGEKKALALYRFFAERDERRLVIALSGVWNWRGVIGREPHETIPGQYNEVRGPIPDFDKVEWNKRNVSILFDTNVHTNPDVLQARRALTRELQARDAFVHWVDLPADCPLDINGVDDFLSDENYGPDALAAILEKDERQGEVSRATSVIELTDAGMVERLWQSVPGDFLYVEVWDKWASWTGTHWSFTHGQADLEAAIKRVARLSQEHETSHADPDQFAKWCTKYRNTTGLVAVRKQAEQDRRFRRSVDEFDRDPWLLNVANGTLDLQTGDLYPHTREHLMTRILSIGWNEDARAPKWNAFLQKIFEGDQSLIDFCLAALGYSLTGDTSEQVFFCCYGKGANGKSTLLETVRKMLGEYGKMAAASSFEERRDSAGHNDDLAGLKGARMIVASESNESVVLNEALVKRLTGERTLRVAFKYGSYFEYEITYKIWLAVNHKPEIRGLDDGIWRRVILIPFQHRIAEADRVKGYEDVLLTEAEGILVSLVRSLWTKIERGGFRVPEAIKTATRNYQREADLIGPFLENCCAVEPQAEEFAGALFKEYARYCEQNAERVVTQHTFGRRLADHRLVKRHTRSGSVWQGVRLLTQTEREGLK